MNGFLAAASALSALTWAVHTFVGGPEIATPLLNAEMPAVPKFTAYYCWHLVTLTLAAMAVGFGYAAFDPGGWDVAVLATGLAASFAGWSLALVRWSGRHPLELPQWVLFLGIFAAALPGLL